MEHTAHIIGAIFMYALIFGAFTAALWWRVRLRLRLASDVRPEHSHQVESGETPLGEINAQ